MHEKQMVFCFFKRKINLKVLNFFFLNFFRKVSKKIRYFNTRFVSYDVSYKLDIMQN